MDHQPPRRAFADASGRTPPERLSEYFDFERWPEKAEKKVTRHELAVILSRHARVQAERRWHRRLWAWLRARVGSGPVTIAAESPTAEVAP